MDPTHAWTSASVSPLPLSWWSPTCFAQTKAHVSLAYSAPQGAGSSSFHGGPAMSEGPKALTFDTTLHTTCLPPAVFCPLHCWPFHPGSAECPFEPCPPCPDSSIPVLFINSHSQDPSSPIGEMPGKKRFSGNRWSPDQLSPPTAPPPRLRYLSPHPASQLLSHLLQLVDTLFHTADGRQRAQRLGVQAPETVLAADLEECYDPALLPRERECHVTSLGHDSWG